MKPQPTGALPDTGVDNNEIVSSNGRNNEKSPKSDFTKPMHKAEKSNFLSLDAKQAFT